MLLMPDFDDIPDALDGELDGAPDAAPDNADDAAPDILDADETTDDLAYQLGPDAIPNQAQTDAIFGVMSEADPDAAAALKSEWGQNAAHNVSFARAAVSTFASSELIVHLDETGLGNHPALIAAAAEIGCRPTHHRRRVLRTTGDASCARWNYVRIRSASPFPLATRFATQRGGTSSDRR